ncbi:MAG: MoxR family ATPase [Planctomycetota bacterium]|nr:MoxR family ATPase [Planctomycetota bacterium]
MSNLDTPDASPQPVAPVAQVAQVAPDAQVAPNAPVALEALENAADAPARAKRKPARRSLLTRPLGLEGWDDLEPVVLAALVSEDPLLLVGTHGSAKSFLLERLAQALGLVYRFYNASLIHFDDLVGIPVPDETQRALRYISTPTSIWDAQVVFIDELNRTKPELQNKIFPIVHERRVQGVRLEKLVYRWAAMNPPPGEDGDDSSSEYLGAEPLDPALADRFAFLIQVPAWRALHRTAQKRVLLDQFAGPHDFPVGIHDLIGEGQRIFRLLRDAVPPRLAEHFVAIEECREKADAEAYSARRMTMLLRNTLALQAARVALQRAAHPGASVESVDWDTSAWLALLHGNPGTARHQKLDRAALLAIHRQAWALSGLEENDPWRELLAVADPGERMLRALRMGTLVGDEDLSTLILDGIASVKPESHRVATALAVYLAVHRDRGVRATVIETLGADVRRVLRPVERTIEVATGKMGPTAEVGQLLASMPAEAQAPNARRDAYARNLLRALLPDGYAGSSPKAVLELFRKLWDDLGVERALGGGA